MLRTWVAYRMPKLSPWRRSMPDTPGSTSFFGRTSISRPLAISKGSTRQGVDAVLLQPVLGLGLRVLRAGAPHSFVPSPGWLLAAKHPHEVLCNFVGRARSGSSRHGRAGHLRLRCRRCRRPDQAGSPCLRPRPSQGAAGCRRMAFGLPLSKCEIDVVGRPDLAASSACPRPRTCLAAFKALGEYILCRIIGHGASAIVDKSFSTPLR